MDWLNEQIEQTAGDPVILLFHKYFPIGDVNGDGIYFKKDKPTDWPDEKRCSEGLLKILNENSNIRAMIVGHGHSNVYEKINFPGGHGIYQIETGGLGENPDNWRLFQFTENEIIVNEVGGSRPELSIPISD